MLENDEDLNDGYIIELSTEFFQKKVCFNRGLIGDLTPFFRFNVFNENKQNRLTKLLDYSKYTFEIGDKIENIYNLFRNKNVELLKKFLLSENNKWSNALKSEYSFSKIKNYIDTLMISKYYLTALLRNSMTDSISDEINKISSKFSNLIKKNSSAVEELVVFLNNENYFDKYMEKIPKYICNYLKYFNHLIPVDI